MSEINSLIEFVPGTKAIATDVNSNFNDLKNGHNDHETRIFNLEDNVIKKDGSIAFNNTLDLNENTISNLSSAKNDLDAVNLKQLNQTINNINLAQALPLPYSANSGVVDSTGKANFINKISENEVAFDLSTALSVTYPDGTTRTFDRLKNITNISSNDTYYIIQEKEEIDESILTGTVSIEKYNKTVTGIDTIFASELTIGDKIKINGEIKTVSAILNDNSLTVEDAFNCEDAIGLNYSLANPIAKAVIATITERSIFPLSPTTNDYHLDLSIKPNKPYKFDGSNWVECQFVKLGEITKNNDITGTPISYALNGQFTQDELTIGNNGTYNINHNIGSDCLEFYNEQMYSSIWERITYYVTSNAYGAICSHFGAKFINQTSKTLTLKVYTGYGTALSKTKFKIRRGF